MVARLAALSCNAEKQQALDALTRSEGARFAGEYIETAEHHYVDILSVKVIEMRLR